MNVQNKNNSSYVIIGIALLLLGGLAPPKWRVDRLLYVLTFREVSVTYNSINGNQKSDAKKFETDRRGFWKGNDFLISRIKTLK